MNRIASLLLFFLAACAGGAEGILVRNVRIVDVENERIVDGQEIWVVGDTIRAVGPEGESGARTKALIDGEGAYALPGLIDAHVHIDTTARLALMLPEAEGLELSKADLADDLAAYIPFGVTTIMVLEGEPDVLAMRDGAPGVLRPRPRIFTASPILDGPDAGNPTHRRIRSPEEGAAAVDEAKTAGYDFIKVYSGLPEESFKAIIARAKEIGMRTTGHLPPELPLEVAIDPRLDNIAHAEEITRSWDGEDETHLTRAIDLMASRSVSLTPNLDAYREIIGEVRDIDAHLAAKDMALTPPVARIYSTPPYNGYVSDFDKPDLRDRVLAYFERMTGVMDDLTRKANEAGVLILAGSDTGNPTMFPGASLLEEIALLRAAGLNGFEALAAATVNPARFLGVDDRLGRIAPGMSADIVLVDVDPSSEALTRGNIVGVMRAGDHMTRAELRSLAESLESAFNAREKEYRTRTKAPAPEE